MSREFNAKWAGLHREFLFIQGPEPSAKVLLQQAWELTEGRSPRAPYAWARLSARLTEMASKADAIHWDMMETGEVEVRGGQPRSAIGRASVNSSGVEEPSDITDLLRDGSDANHRNGDGKGPDGGCGA